MHRRRGSAPRAGAPRALRWPRRANAMARRSRSSARFHAVRGSNFFFFFSFFFSELGPAFVALGLGSPTPLSLPPFQAKLELHGSFPLAAAAERWNHARVLVVDVDVAGAPVISCRPAAGVLFLIIIIIIILFLLF